MPDSPLELQLVQRLKCPLCGSGLSTMPCTEKDGSEENEARCGQCGACYPRLEGIWRMLTEQERRQYQPFMEGYPAIRQREGWKRDEAYYLSLPYVLPGDPTSFVWRIRRRSLSVLDRVLQHEQAHIRDVEHTKRTLWALDLGAGNGWLSRYLTSCGYRTVALDLIAAGLDSLAGIRLHTSHDHTWIGRVQASMSKLPLCDETFALCTISGALHYADSEATLAEARRVLTPGGLLVITDSPVYSNSGAGVAMASERRRRIKALLGEEPPQLPGGQNFLVKDKLVAQMRTIGFQVSVIPTERVLGKLKRLVKRWLKPGAREEARFPVIVGRKSYGPRQ